MLSNQERLDSPQDSVINGLVCYTLRGQPEKVDVRLNSADGFAAPTVCQCDLIWVLQKQQLHDGLGPISWERQQAIKLKLKETLRL